MSCSSVCAGCSVVIAVVFLPPYPPLKVWSLPGLAACSRFAPTWLPSQISPLFTSFPHIPSSHSFFLLQYLLHLGSDSQQPPAMGKMSYDIQRQFFFQTIPCLSRSQLCSPKLLILLIYLCEMFLVFLSGKAKLCSDYKLYYCIVWEYLKYTVN